MGDRIKKYLIVVTMAVGILFSMAMPVFAYTGDEVQEADTDTETITRNMNVETEDAPITEEASDTEEAKDNESQGRVQGTPFSVPGNGQLVDDLSEDTSKQFLTVQTKNGNTFFIVLDRSNNTENVYMLSMIDENDLAEFIGETKKEPEPEQPSVIIPETKPSVPDEPETEVKPEEKKGGMNIGALLAVIVLLAGGIGGYYYFKVLKPRQDGDEADGEDLEFYDGGVYVNEEQSDSDKEGEDE